MTFIVRFSVCVCRRNNYYFDTYGSCGGQEERILIWTGIFLVTLIIICTALLSVLRVNFSALIILSRNHPTFAFVCRWGVGVSFPETLSSVALDFLFLALTSVFTHTLPNYHVCSYRFPGSPFGYSYPCPASAVSRCMSSRVTQFSGLHPLRPYTPS